MKKITLLFICLLSNFVFSHTINYDNIVLRHWSIQKEHKCIDGTFMMLKNGTVFIEEANNTISKFPLSYLSKEDQAFVLKKEEWVKNLNTISPQKQAGIQSIFDYKFWIILFSLLAFGYYIYSLSDKKKLNYLYPVLFLGIVISLYSFTKKALSTTDPLFMKSAFDQFSSTVSTTYDVDYFYVNSTGIPNHTMMVGIASGGWQQQVPTSKCYINTSHWTIPLKPVLATNSIGVPTPVPVSAAHFLKGAIAIAVNGVPIFNYHTNTGFDSFTDGQLDEYGGHCGRGDDYHYHIAPLKLITELEQASATLPIAFGLDGYAVYGGLEPSGLAMTALDGNHGHYGTNGVYHYHGTIEAPYMIGNMVGQVTEDADKQIIPQPQGRPIRTENWTPLTGAVITSCVANANNGYNTAYTLGGISGYATNYTSTQAGIYTFQYVTPFGTTTTPYTGPALCTVPNLTLPEFALNDKNISVYPNPATDVLNVKVNNGVSEKDVQSISIYGIKGELISKTLHYKQNIDIKTLSKGTYLVKIQFPNYLVTKKVLVK